MEAIVDPGDHLKQHNLPYMIQGDQLWLGTTCGMTVLFHKYFREIKIKLSYS